MDRGVDRAAPLLVLLGAAALAVSLFLRWFEVRGGGPTYTAWQAFSKADPADKIRVRTDKDGRVAVALPKGGVWLVKAVHMVPMARFVRGDWESFWASLTFEAP